MLQILYVINETFGFKITCCYLLRESVKLFLFFFAKIKLYFRSKTQGMDQSAKSSESVTNVFNSALISNGTFMIQFRPYLETVYSSRKVWWIFERSVPYNLFWANQQKPDTKIFYGVSVKLVRINVHWPIFCGQRQENCIIKLEHYLQSSTNMAAQLANDLSHTKHSSFSVFGLLKLSNFLKYWSSFLTNTGTNYVPMSIPKFIPVYTI